MNEWMKEWMNEWMDECLTTLQHKNHKNRSAIGCQNKVDAWNGYQIKKYLKNTV